MRQVEERHCLLPPALSRVGVRNQDLKALKTEISERRRAGPLEKQPDQGPGKNLGNGCGPGVCQGGGSFLAQVSSSSPQKRIKETWCDWGLWQLGVK